jgi:hypothetical protein
VQGKTAEGSGRFCSVCNRGCVGRREYMMILLRFQASPTSSVIVLKGWNILLVTMRVGDRMCSWDEVLECCGIQSTSTNLRLSVITTTLH